MQLWPTISEVKQRWVRTEWNIWVTASADDGQADETWSSATLGVVSDWMGEDDEYQHRGGIQRWSSASLGMVSDWMGEDDEHQHRGWRTSE